MQVQDGSLTELKQSQFEKLVADFQDKAPVVRIGDRFKVRHCYFEVTEINPDGIVAKGISKDEYKSSIYTSSRGILKDIKRKLKEDMLTNTTGMTKDERNWLG